MGAIGITPRQHDALTFIHGCNLCPSFSEIQTALGMGSISSVTRVLVGLEERGHIRRLRRRDRAIEVLIPPRPRRTRPAVVPIRNLPRSACGAPTPAWDYPFRDHRTCAEWGDAEAADAR